MQGRPRKFNKVEEMEKAIKAYFRKQDRRNKPYTIQGLALALDFNSRQSFLNYEGYLDDNDQGFLDTIKKARLEVENNKVEGMLSGDYSATGVIFDLKNNHGHKDKSSLDVNVDKGEMTEEELEQRIAELEKRVDK